MVTGKDRGWIIVAMFLLTLLNFTAGFYSGYNIKEDAMSEKGEVFSNEMKWSWSDGEKLKGTITDLIPIETEYKGNKTKKRIFVLDYGKKVVLSNPFYFIVRQQVHILDLVEIEYVGRQNPEDDKSQKIFKLTVLDKGDAIETLEDRENKHLEKRTTEGE